MPVRTYPELIEAPCLVRNVQPAFIVKQMANTAFIALEKMANTTLPSLVEIKSLRPRLPAVLAIKKLKNSITC